MDLARKILNPISGIFPTAALRSISGQKLILPFYHLVSDDPPPHIKHLYPTRSVQRFREDLDFLLKFYEPLTIEQLGSKGGFFLSFDDGLRECAEIIAPILSERGIPAAFFINSEFIANRGLFYRYKASLLVEAIKNAPPEKIRYFTQTLLLDKRPLIQIIKKITYARRHRLDELAVVLDVDFDEYLELKKPYLSQTQLGALKDQGFYIGNHSADHPKFAVISPEEQLKQLRDCQRFLLSGNFKSKYAMFSFPFTDAGVMSDFFNSMYAEGIDLSFGSAGLKTDSVSRHYQRIPMEMSSWPAKNVINTEYIYWLLKAPLGRNKIRRR